MWEHVPANTSKLRKKTLRCNLVQSNMCYQTHRESHLTYIFILMYVFVIPGYGKRVKWQCNVESIKAFHCVLVGNELHHLSVVRQPISQKTTKCLCWYIVRLEIRDVTLAKKLDIYKWQNVRAFEEVMHRWHRDGRDLDSSVDSWQTAGMLQWCSRMA